jgi:hypothetical protein
MPPIDGYSAPVSPTSTPRPSACGWIFSSHTGPPSVRPPPPPMPWVKPMKQRSEASEPCATVPSANSWSRHSAQIAYDRSSQRSSKPVIARPVAREMSSGPDVRLSWSQTLPDPQLPAEVCTDAPEP